MYTADHEYEKCDVIEGGARVAFVEFEGCAYAPDCHKRRIVLVDPGGCLLARTFRKTADLSCTIDRRVYPT